MSLLELEEQAIVKEFESYGTEADKANLRYILHGTACEEPLPDHVHEFDEGHRGVKFEDFVAHPNCVQAQLRRPHVLSLRMYTSSSYPRFNTLLTSASR
mmetsp:Transcript_24128/g.66629  ORF Transcript_24128/g.66629 Transcript_24128/m.66629 type:complete len:99 (-) Transcript_24128:324-620(-)|eukprot:scaffold170091_cov26-Tisochrysis_lutea.AAC.1